MRSRRRQVGTVGLLVGIFLIAFVIRAYRPTSWVDQKLGRAIVFADELLAGHWAGTYQQPHPGVTQLAAAGLTVRLYESLAGSPAELLFSWAIPLVAIESGRQTALGVYGISVVVAALIVAITFALYKLSDWRLALATAGLLAFSPYHIAQSRVVQLDALMSSFMLLSALLLLISLQEERRVYLLLSGLAGGFAVLTKTPGLFLLPFTGLTLLTHLFARLRREAQLRQRPHQIIGEALRYLILPGLLWATMAALPFLLWPAMWVQPRVVLRDMFAGVGDIGGIPHEVSVFFAGRVYFGEAPGVFFYPVTLAFKSTFLTLTLTLLALGHYVVWRKRVKLPVNPLQFWLLVAYSFFFTIMMSLGSKKLARYGLPALAMLEVLAAVGLVGLADLLRRATQGSRDALARALPVTLIGLAVGLQALVALIFAPDYGAHHNYLLGGNRVALRAVELIERNEGIVYVANYLSQEPEAASKRVITWFPATESLVQLYPGEVIYGYADPLPSTDYYLFSRANMQRQIDVSAWTPSWQEYRDRTAQVVVHFDGVPYLWLHRAQPAESAPPMVIRRGGMAFVVLAWVWTLGLVGALVRALRRAE